MLGIRQRFNHLTEEDVKRLIPLLTVATAALLAVGAAVLSASEVPSASSHTSESAAIPRPVEEALSIVASYRGAGPLTVDPTAGSVALIGWASTSEDPNSGVLQHWSLRATDKSGAIVLGISVMDNRMELVAAWVPGASQTNTWTFNTRNASPGSAHHVTVPGATWSLSHSSPNTK